MCSPPGAGHEAVRVEVPEGLATITAHPGIDADVVHLLGEYRCGELGHPYSRCLMEFKDQDGRFGRAPDGRRLHQERFAACVAAVIETDPRLREYPLIIPVPPKRHQDPASYHLLDLVNELGKMAPLASREMSPGALRFRGDVPPIKQVRLERRCQVITGEIECTVELAGKAAILLDDIVASGSTAAECIRALRAKGCARVALIALARRVTE